jgi:2-keto-4-pentenoate hydratase/2-oxohepta-3-ene-1,7-dioic acid hydratase in catechol pathway
MLRNRILYDAFLVRRRVETVRLVTFAARGKTGIGVLGDDGSVVDLAADPALPATMVDLVSLGSEGLVAAASVADSAQAIPPGDVRLLAPIRPRNNVMAVGRNYRDHAGEFSASGFDASEKKMIPDHPIIFTKAASSIIGPGDAIDVANDPLGTSDYEGELGVVLGPGGTRISRAEAWDHVYGYTVVNDVTARELQRQHVQFFIGKSPATYCPMGPCIVTRDEIPDITSRVLTTRVNGDLRQEAKIADLIFDIPTLVESISAAVLIEPGDVIATGTPAGVGIGMDPPVYLRSGDVVEVSIDGVGTLVNPVI